jgi:hypothetical protein
MGKHARPRSHISAGGARLLPGGAARPVAVGLVAVASVGAAGIIQAASGEPNVSGAAEAPGRATYVAVCHLTAADPTQTGTPSVTDSATATAGRDGSPAATTMLLRARPRVRSELPLHLAHGDVRGACPGVELPAALVVDPTTGVFTPPTADLPTGSTPNTVVDPTAGTSTPSAAGRSPSSGAALAQGGQRCTPTCSPTSSPTSVSPSTTSPTTTSPTTTSPTSPTGSVTPSTTGTATATPSQSATGTPTAVATGTPPGTPTGPSTTGAPAPSGDGLASTGADRKLALLAGSGLVLLATGLMAVGRKPREATAPAPRPRRG